MIRHQRHLVTVTIGVLSILAFVLIDYPQSGHCGLDTDTDGDRRDGGLCVVV